MKKSLLFSAAALMALSMFADTWKIETVWANNQVGPDCNPFPNVEGGWGSLDKNPATVSSTCTRFAVGKDGKFLTNEHKQNAIVALGPNGAQTVVAKLPARTADRWNGTAIAVDDAGNIIFNYCFIDVNKSKQLWGVAKPDGSVVDIELSTPLADLGTTGRLDCLGHVVGDVTSEKGGIGYATTGGSGVVIMYHFKGVGSASASLTAKKCTVTLSGLALEGNESQLNYAVPSKFSVDEILAAKYPENCFYIPIGMKTWGSPEGAVLANTGFLGNFTDEGAWSPLYGFGNRLRNAVASFQYKGETYIVRNYLTDEFIANNPAYTDNMGVMNFGVFDMNSKCVASWQESYFANGNGMATLTVEPVDDNTFNIYTFFATGSAQSETSTVAGCYGAMTKLTVTEGEPVAPVELAGKGTEAEPYLIGTAADLCAAHLYIPQDVPGDYVYFKQTADIDMAGVENWQALNGWYGGYQGKFIYDGDNHVIRNFKGVDKAEVDANGGDDKGGYYDTSIFGVVRGTVMNLGVIDAYTEETNNFDGAGILSDYSGQGGEPAVYDNVFVTGKVKGIKRTGGMFAHAGGDNILSHVYAVVEVNGGSNEAGGIIGKLNGKKMTLDQGYVAAKLTTTGSKGLIAGGTGTVDIADFMTVGEGDATASGITVIGSEYLTKFESASADFFRAIGDYEDFNEGKELETAAFGKMPTFNWMTASQISGEEGPVELAGKGTEAEPYLIGTAADLCAAHLYIPQDVPGDYVYFKQTADIDMAGVDNWQALNGWYGGYQGKFIYDGDNHVIRNFKGVDKAEVDANGGDDKGGYYDTSIFGVARGTVMNLGVIDAYTEETNNFDGAGILSDYSGQGGEPAVYDNVFVTGKVKGIKRTGGMFAHAGDDNILSHVYAVVEVNGGSNETGGIIGKLNGKKMTLDQGYVAAKLTTTGSKGLIAGGTGTVDIADFMTVGEGDATASGITVIGSEYLTKFESASADFFRAIGDYEDFFDGKELETAAFGKMPTFNWMTADQISAVDDVVVDENEANAPAVYYNLQGVEVANPQNGLYIKKQGNKVSKVVIR